MLFAAAALVGAWVSAPAYEVPRISLSATHLSGAVDASGDPAVTVDVEQAGVPAGFLRLRVVSSGNPAVAGVADVRQQRTPGGDRSLTVWARGQGYTDLTLQVTGRGGKTATATLSYAASAPVGDAPATRYLTGSADASAAVDVGGGHVLVADDESDVLRLYDGSRSGAPVRSWDLGAALGAEREADIEAAARVGDTVYWTGSLGNARDGTYRAERNTVFTTRITGSGAGTEVVLGGVHRGLREDLLAWDAARGNRYGFAAGTGGLDVEGLEFAPGSTTTAYLGLRAPRASVTHPGGAVGGKALIVPVTNVDRVLADGAKAVFGPGIELDLGGLAVRDIRKNAAGQYLILAGSGSGSGAADGAGGPSALYAWDGVPAHAPTKRADLPATGAGGAWEAVVSVPDLRTPGSRVQLISDNGGADLYGDGRRAKDLEHPEWKKARAAWFTLR